ncbi:hypothetical protein JOC54_003168 [Alkalihalobacillus xiaoxiensis]|uniref:Uncharacterized protein n=1 Tax=Shouchella xiaoxiensis TaxID=766895 RepID=A0ABS2SWH6_9BACI|nr:hypothetical protein [Shouchella xiaoxiensis]
METRTRERPGFLVVESDIINLYYSDAIQTEFVFTDH